MVNGVAPDSSVGTDDGSEVAANVGESDDRESTLTVGGRASGIGTTAWRSLFRPHTTATTTAVVDAATPSQGPTE